MVEVLLLLLEEEVLLLSRVLRDIMRGRLVGRSDCFTKRDAARPD